jgi:hypothetical protein
LPERFGFSRWPRHGRIAWQRLRGIRRRAGSTKTADQLDLQALHRVRQRLVSQRTGALLQRILKSSNEFSSVYEGRQPQAPAAWHMQPGDLWHGRRAAAPPTPQPQRKAADRGADAHQAATSSIRVQSSLPLPERLTR